MRSAVRSPRSPLTVLAVVALLGLSMVVSLAPTATAQAPPVDTQLTVHIPRDVLEEPIPPGTTRTINFTANYSWPDSGYSRDPTEITFSVRPGGAPSWVSIEWLPQSFTYVSVWPECASEADCNEPFVGGSRNITHAMNVTVLEEAPSFQPSRLLLNARAEENTDNGNLKGDNWNNDGDLHFVTAGVLAQVGLSSSEAFVQIRGGETRTIPVDVQNTGNANVTVALSARDVPEGLEVALPSQVEVPHEGTTTVNMTVRVLDALQGGQTGFVLEGVPRWTQDAAVRGPRAMTEVTVDITPLPQAVLLGQMTLNEVFIFTGGLVVAFFVVGWPMTVWWEDRRKRQRAAARAGTGSSTAGPRNQIAGDAGSGSLDDGTDRPAGGPSGRGTGSGPRPGAVAPGAATAHAHGVPEEGDDYTVVDDAAIEDHFVPAGSDVPTGPDRPIPAETARPAHATGEPARATGAREAPGAEGPERSAPGEPEGKKKPSPEDLGVPEEGDDYVLVDESEFDEDFERAA